MQDQQSVFTNTVNETKFDDEMQPIGKVIEDIRKSALTNKEQGEKFEDLVRHVLPTLPEYEIKSVMRYSDWSGSCCENRNDLGIDLVGELNSGSLVAIQCKFWEENRRLAVNDIDSFLSLSAAQREGERIFEYPMLIATCGINRNAENHLRMHEGKYISFYHAHRTDPLNYTATRKPHRPLLRQQEAIDACVKGFEHHARGRLVMACGTGKTFTALKICESVEAMNILFVAPSIALVGQARKEWMRQTERDLRTLIVCSDSSAGHSSDEEVGLMEMNCPVTRNPSVIGKFLQSEGRVNIIFCTHQSLRKITESQKDTSVPTFDLVVIDEAHWTTGINKTSSSKRFSFQDVHSEEFVKASKRLYMTATPRVYTKSSKQRLESKGYQIHDMDDTEIYGPEFYRLNFRQAIQSDGADGKKMLCDYRVIVLAVPEREVSEEMKRRLEKVEKSSTNSIRKSGLERHITRLYGTSLALNGHIQGNSSELPDRLRRVIGYCNTIASSKWYAKAMMDSKVKERTTRTMDDPQRVATIHAEHLDARNNALERNKALDRLRSVASKHHGSELLCNVRLFSEGVDVPSLDAVVFLEPRRSQVDVVQAVGRVMRRGEENKKLGYVVVPVVVPRGSTTLSNIERDESGYQVIGQVLRALQSHDGRLAEEIAQRVIVAVPDTDHEMNGPGSSNTDENEAGDSSDQTSDIFGEEIQTIATGLMTKIVDASGIGSSGQLNANDIIYSVERAGALFHAAGAAEILAPAVGKTFKGDGKSAKNICKIASLLIANACLLHKRLSGIEALPIKGLEGMGATQDPAQALRDEWNLILEKDYAPIFRPALHVLEALPEDANCISGIYRLISCANSIADSLSELGYDHAGPLYHRILDTAESDGAFYTKNMAALFLSRLAIQPDSINCDSVDRAAELRVIDPACGTGTLLMASLKTIKERVLAELPKADRSMLHKALVEKTIFGLDINHQAVQLAASNLTLGGLSVDYERMNTFSMPHGFDSEGRIEGAGSLELLLGESLPFTDADEGTRTFRQAGSRQVVDSVNDLDPKHAFDLVIMNPPYTNNENRRKIWSAEQKSEMGQYERIISDEVGRRQGQSAQATIDYNSISTFFTPLADHLVKRDSGTLAKVMPVTACISASGLMERQFLASRFHIEMLVTCHAPSKFSFSGKTDIHECLMVARRSEAPPFKRPATKIIVLHCNLDSAEEVDALASAIHEQQDMSTYGQMYEWPAERVVNGDWNAVQWYDCSLAEDVLGIEANQMLEAVGGRYVIRPDSRAIRDTYKPTDLETEDAIPGFHSVSAVHHKTLEGKPDTWYHRKKGKVRAAARYENQRGHVLVVTRLDTISGRLTAMWSSVPSFGSWVPIAVPDKFHQKALTVWWNSTPARMMLMNRRTKKLTYPNFSMEHLREIRIPKPDNPAWSALKAAYDQMSNQEILPIKHAAQCEVRKAIDEVAAKALGLPSEKLLEWRQKLSSEPTVSNVIPVST